MKKTPYIDPRTGALRNKLGLKTAAALDRNERKLTAQRTAEGVPKGQFDLRHLRAIHRHLFQDI
jgi:cell filamentation protein